MSRWHHAGCLSPQVEIKNGLPECRSCSQSPDLADLMTTNASSILSIPEDESSGSMNLWWPPSVPYCNNVESCNEGDCLNGSNHAVQTASACVQMLTANLPNSSTVYPRALKSTDIRLAVLSTAESDDFPVHLELEIYELDDCPEYEAVSYLWGGENNDNTLCCPVYVGPFWDVLFQTKNCWDMLKFMRPLRGIRMVWVDAVCINQEDVLERNQQVANMSRIYSGCTRVIVYLGSDIVTPLNGRYPRRHPLHDLETGSVVPVFSRHQQAKPPLTVASLLARRYFSRIWVIQELLLPCHVLIRIGDVDFWADGSTANHISDLYTSLIWSESAAEWFGHMCRAVQFRQNTSHLLDMTSNSEATDPRDRVFGLLGIAQAEDSFYPRAQGRGLRAEYSLSCQHVFIGIFAHCLLNSGQNQVLYAARGTKAQNGCPSWVPRWESQEEWRRVFGSPEFRDGQAVQLVMALELHRNLLPERYTFEAYRLENDWGCGPMKMDDQVCSHTGALYINVTQYMSIKSQPVRIGKHNQYHIFRLRPHRMYPVYIFSRQLLDKLDFMGSEQVFVHNSSLHPQNPACLILRPVDGTLNSFQLIAACPQIVIGEIKATYSKRTDLRRHVYRYKPLPLMHLHSSLSCTVKDVRELCKEKLDFTGSDDKDWLIQSLFPHAEIVGDLLEPCVCLIVMEQIQGTATQSTLEETSLKICHAMEGAVMETGHFVLTLEQHRNLWQRFIHLGYLHNAWEVYGEDHEWQSVSARMCRKEAWSLGDGINVRCRGSYLIEAVSNASRQLGQLCFNLRALHRVSTQTGEQIREMLEREPQEEDEYAGCPSWSSSPSLLHDLSVRDALGIAGGTRMVKIV